jgi:ribosomal protein S18 acetylase RimI-like enzyme
MKLEYRPAAPDDFEFLFLLHEAAMRPYVEEAFGPWQADWQRAYFRARFDLAGQYLILFEGQDVGALHVQERAEEIFLVRIEILPAYQGRGIGTAVMQELIERARQAGRPLALRVLKGNLRARYLYQRLGFGVTGESDTHYIMAWYPKE